MMFGNHDLHPFPATHVELGKPLVLPSPPLNREAERKDTDVASHRPHVLVREEMTIWRRFRRFVLWSWILKDE